jgi:hypothetical protein
MRMKASGEYLELLEKFNYGQTLKDRTLAVEFVDKESGVLVRSVRLTISNRKVEKQERITTPAGTYDTYIFKQEVKKGTILPVFSLPEKRINLRWYGR